MEKRLILLNRSSKILAHQRRCTQKEGKMPETLKPKEKLYPRRPDHVVWKVIEGKGILLNLENGAYFEVNPVGLAMWEKCDGKTGNSNLAESISREFKITAQRALKDFSNFVSDLKRRKLLEVSGEPQPSLSRA